MAERGIEVDYTIIMRWIHQYSPEIEKKIRRHLKPTNNSWRIDVTYIKVKGKWKYFTEQLTQLETQLISCLVQNEKKSREKVL